MSAESTKVEEEAVAGDKAADESRGASTGKPMLRVDVHTHILPKEWPSLKDRYGYGGFIRLEHHCEGRAKMYKDDGRFFREIEDNCWWVSDVVMFWQRGGRTPV